MFNHPLQTIIPFIFASMLAGAFATRLLAGDTKYNFRPLLHTLSTGLGVSLLIEGLWGEVTYRIVMGAFLAAGCVLNSALDGRFTSRPKEA